MRLQDLQRALEGNRRKPSAGSQFGIMSMGAAIGAAAGMLLAPHSGKVTRQKIRQRAQFSADKTTAKIHNRTDALKDKAEVKLESTKDAAQNAIEEGKRSAKESSGAKAKARR